MNKMPVRLKKAMTALSVAVIWVLVWQALSAAASRGGLGLLLPAPLQTLAALGELVTQKSFYVSCAKTLLRVVTGWFFGLTAGVILGILTFLSKALNALFSPVLHIVKATPVASFIIAALVLMSAQKVPAFTGFLITLPVVWANISEGLSAPDKKLLEAASFFKMSKKNTVRFIYIPAMKPYFAAAATTAMGLSWKACVAAEVICTPSGSIGQGIYNAKVYLETPSLFAWTGVVIILSIILEKIIKAVIAKFVGEESKK